MRDGGKLSPEEINHFVEAISKKKEDGSAQIHDAQIGAFLMAAFLKGLSMEETIQLTHAMTYSGFTFSWPEEWDGKIVDKHSTGGVGDKVSLVLAPALAACGMKVPMVSGRGLDFTGGTLDKLEAIPGFQTSLTPERILEALEQVGCCIVGQTPDLVPADRTLYAIRDVTATVDNQDLIVASIISKKAAEKLNALVLDVKVGTGAFMKDLAAASDLATKLVEIGRSFNMNVAAVLTRMDDPIGTAIGNALEVHEAIVTLKNQGPPDLMELVVSLGGKLLEMTGVSESLVGGCMKIRACIENGSALTKFEDMIVFQGADAGVGKEICYGDPWKYLPKASYFQNVVSDVSGVVESIDAMKVARACLKLGCGRMTPTDSVELSPGVVLKKKRSDEVKKGEVIAEVHFDKTDLYVRDEVVRMLLEAFQIGERKCCQNSLIIKILE